MLPFAARSGLLLNLAGSAPLLSARQCVTLHDAAVFDHPEAYTGVFVTWYRALFRHHATHAHKIFTVSRFSRARLAARLCLAPEDIGVVHNGGGHLDAVLADDRILDLHGLRGCRYLLAVGSASATKNIDRLEQAFASLSTATDVRLVIVGGGNAQVFVGSAAQEPGFDTTRVLRTGPLDDAPLKALYQHAQALVFPSVYEGFGLPPLEAMSCACPVAAARAASMPEVCGEAALYFDPLSVQDIANALQRLLSEPQLRHRLAAAGPAQAARFSWQEAALELRGHIGALA
ncbi:MAG: glycosyltransferase family 1 protein [Rubrivivax sp.]|nr:glycosyltransferase family 1 protein [Rubrivivax sp.]